MSDARPLVIYHGNCYDGFGAAFAAWLKFGDAADYLPASYGEPPPDCAGREVYIVDFSYRRDVLERMHVEAASLLVLDHHKTSQDALAGLDYAQFDMNRSGAVMAWQHFLPVKVGDTIDISSFEGFGGPAVVVADRGGGTRFKVTMEEQPAPFYAHNFEIEVPLFFRYLQDRDLWRFKLHDSAEFTYGLRSLPMDFSVWREWWSRTAEIIERGRSVKDYCGELVKVMAAEAREITLAGQPMLACNATALFSEVADELLKRGQHPVAACWRDMQGQRIWGMRSAPDFDCSVIAKHYGGGGHKNAAGFQSEIGWLP